MHNRHILCVIASVLLPVFCACGQCDTTLSVFNSFNVEAQTEKGNFLVQEIILRTAVDHVFENKHHKSVDYCLIALADSSGNVISVVTLIKKHSRHEIKVGNKYYFELYPQKEKNHIGIKTAQDVQIGNHKINVIIVGESQNCYLTPNLNGLKYRPRPSEKVVRKVIKVSFRKEKYLTSSNSI